MNKILLKKGLSFLVKMSQLPYLLAIRDGFVLAITPTIIGSLFLLVASLPVPGYFSFMANLFGQNWQSYLLNPLASSFAVISLLLSLTVSYKLASRYGLNAISVALISMICFFMETPYSITDEGLISIPIANIGSQGIFVAILIALVSTELFRFFVARNWVIRLPASVPEAISGSFLSLIPGFLTVCIVWLFLLIFDYLGISLYQLMESTIAEPLAHATNTLPMAVFYAASNSLLWFMGVHGDHFLDTVFISPMLQLLDENRILYQQGLEPINIVVKPFFDTYVHLGGTGATLPLVCCMALFSRSSQLKAVGRLALPTSLFQINEPVLFGLPIILNPLMLLPFVLVPVVLTITSYFAMTMGLLPKPTGVLIPWATPIFLSGYLVSGGSWLGIVWQVINLVIATLIYYPFFKIVDILSKEA